MSETAQAKATHSSPQQSELPSGWRWVRLEEITSVVNGTTPDSENPCFWNGDIVWITPTDLGKLAEPYIRNSVRKITKAGFDSRNLTRVPSRSVVLSSRAPVVILESRRWSFARIRDANRSSQTKKLMSGFFITPLSALCGNFSSLEAVPPLQKYQKRNWRTSLSPFHRLKSSGELRVCCANRWRRWKKPARRPRRGLRRSRPCPPPSSAKSSPSPGQSLPDGCRWAPLKRC